MSRGRAACVDVGSTFTKGALVELPSGRLLGTAAHPTTAGGDVLRGLDAVLAELGATGGDEVLVCSSAGGGLRLAVVGNERAITAEAGRRVGLSAGARVVHVSAGPLDDGGVERLLDDRPDVVLLVGGTDGGNAEVLLHNAAALGRSRLRAPVVVAGNVKARDEVARLLGRGGHRSVPVANVLPCIGVLDPEPARSAIRAVFVQHVIGGKGLSPDPRFAGLVRAATPDAVLTGVELLADATGDVIVVDVGGATTDVYSAVTPDPEEAVLRREVVEVLWRGRTVEGDLGLRWNAVGVLAAASQERLLAPGEEPVLRPAAERRAAEPAYLPDSEGERAVDVR
ncbi:MAG: glutamate mutase L, partial [Actinomycetota bacterium]|nr:glutamate mutase L [Actinomycetota bacterium]